MPVIGISYGYLAMVKVLSKNSPALMPTDMQSSNLEVNLIVNPEDTFVYDHLSTREAD